MTRRNSTAAARLHLETPPGCCLACDEPVPPSPTRPRVICDSPECLTLYNSLMHGEWRARNPAKVKAANKANWDKLKADPVRLAAELKRSRESARKRYAAGADWYHRNPDKVRAANKARWQKLKADPAKMQAWRKYDRERKRQKCPGRQWGES